MMVCWRFRFSFARRRIPSHHRHRSTATCHRFFRTPWLPQPTWHPSAMVLLSIVPSHRLDSTSPSRQSASQAVVGPSCLGPIPLIWRSKIGGGRFGCKLFFGRRRKKILRGRVGPSGLFVGLEPDGLSPEHPVRLPQATIHKSWLTPHNP